ncbi:hypothetical protein SS50377_25818 [Spironucleus salmonicida]|uniref:Uncharacterized protein n=1 Tax=Spironucleus salmonicida TaxID=348837 RepID=V6LMI0_9EUKA|nr:hypothetical protein SS50377_25818 [Spironucleus salmonicida]|eukprot:EST45423.1 hypothetical protein SS50377_14655 [Spironucleus salmonicida]
MYRAYLLHPPKQHIADKLQKEMDLKHKRAKSQIKATVDCSAPRKCTHLSRFTGGGALQQRERQKSIDGQNVKIFNQMRKTFDSKGGYCQENLKHFELPANRISTKMLQEQEQMALHETYIRKIRTSMAVPNSDALRAYQEATGDRFSYDLAMRSVPEIGKIRSKKVPNPNIKPVYNAAAQGSEFKQQQIYAAGKITKPAVLPEIIKVLGGYGGREKREIEEIEYFEGEQNDGDGFDVFADQPQVDIQGDYYGDTIEFGNRIEGKSQGSGQQKIENDDMFDIRNEMQKEEEEEKEEKFDDQNNEVQQQEEQKEQDDFDNTSQVNKLLE